MSQARLKHALLDLLRARRLEAEAPPLSGEDRCLRPLHTGEGAIDRMIGGGFPRGEISELHGPASSGRLALALAVAASVTRERALAAWVDPQDQMDPASAHAAGIDLPRLLWVRGQPGGLPKVVAAAGTLLGSGLFDLVVLDLAGLEDRSRRTLPAASWVRLHRFIEQTPTALLVLGDSHLARSPGGVSLTLERPQVACAGCEGPGRLLMQMNGRALVTNGRPRSSPFLRFA